MSTANISGRLPDGNNNGLAAIAHDLIEDPRTLRTAIVLLDTSKITSKVEERSRTATVRIRHVEPLTTDGDIAAADKLLRAAMRRRTGSTTDLPGVLDQAELPFDEQED